MTEQRHISIKSFRDLIVWQRADELAFKIFDSTDTFPKQYLYDLTSQLRRAALSVPTNIAEGCASFHSGELLQFLNIARRSLSETQYLMEFAERRNLITQDCLTDLIATSTEISKMVNSLVKSIRKKKQKP